MKRAEHPPLIAQKKWAHSQHKMIGTRHRFKYKEAADLICVHAHDIFSSHASHRIMLLHHTQCLVISNGRLIHVSILDSKLQAEDTDQLRDLIH
jgi:hypothetical protein